MKKSALLLTCIAFLFACRSNTTPDKISKSQSQFPEEIKITEEQKAKIRNFVSQRITQLEDSIKRYPANPKFPALKRILTNKLYELK